MVEFRTADAILGGADSLVCAKAVFEKEKEGTRMKAQTAGRRAGKREKKTASSVNDPLHWSVVKGEAAEKVQG
jgi:hypothetical protein